ncbi:T9SS type A sorting domain-containing protein [bacterium]|nr:T9SS type A sorting domain-containing protein [bacterium]
MNTKVIFMSCVIVLSVMLATQIVFANTAPHANFIYQCVYERNIYGLDEFDLYLDASLSWDAEDPGDSLEVRWIICYGYMGEEEWISITDETDWMTDRNHHWHEIDLYPTDVTLEVRDTDGLISMNKKDISIIENGDLIITPPDLLEFGYVNIYNYLDKTVRIGTKFFYHEITDIVSTNPQFEVIGETSYFFTSIEDYYDVVIRFSPTSEGIQCGDLDIFSNYNVCVNSIVMTGYGNPSSSQLPDIQCNPTSLTVNPTNISLGGTFDISGTIENNGISSTGNDFQVNFYICTYPDVLEFQSSYFVGSFIVTVLDPGSSSSFNETITVPETADPGIYYAWVSIDPGGVVEESNEINNQQSCSMPLTVIPEMKTITAPGIPESLLPTIDGSLDDPVWSFFIDEDSLLCGGVPEDWNNPWTSYADNLVTYQVCWSDQTNKLYLAVHVQDDIRGIPDNGAYSSTYAPYLDDAVEFFTDGDHSGGSYAFEQAQQWFVVTLENHLSLSNYPDSEAAYLYTGDDVQTAVQLGTDGNWTCEAEITVYNTFPSQVKILQEGDIIGWDIWYNDSDNETFVEPYYSRDHHTGWYYGGPSYWNADCFGCLMLGSEIEDTGVTPEELSQVVAQFSIQQNYPNPFNPTTQIQYQLPKTSHVHLSVYNLMGQEMVCLVDEVKDAGIYSVEWDGRDSQGAYLPSGIYIYQIRVGEFIESKKLILNR